MKKKYTGGIDELTARFKKDPYDYEFKRAIAAKGDEAVAPMLAEAADINSPIRSYAVETIGTIEGDGATEQRAD